MSVLKLKNGIYSVGVLNPNLRVFDIIMRTDYGTSYNAYLIEDEKCVLVEAVHEDYFDEYLENITSVVPLEKIHYLILNHTEPDHSGSLKRLLEMAPHITVITTAAGKKYLDEIVNMPFASRVVKQGDTLDIGGRTLSFIPSPLLHWPDSMFTYLQADRLVFTCDFLGAHYCEPRMLDKHIKYPGRYLDAFRYYYTAIFGPYRQAVLDGLERLKALDFDMVCTSHGPVLIDGINDRISDYLEWSMTVKHKNDPKKVLILYVSAYGCTKKLAQTAKALIKKAGFDVESLDIIEHDLNKIKELVDKADAIMLGSPTINRDALKPVWDVLSMVDAIINRNKIAAAFGSYGWSGEAVPMIIARLAGLGLKVVGEGYRAKFIPSGAELRAMEDYTNEFIAAINSAQ